MLHDAGWKEQRVLGEIILKGVCSFSHGIHTPLTRDEIQLIPGVRFKKKMCREGLCQNLVLVMDAKSAVVDPIWISYSPYPGSRMIPKPAPRLPFIWEQIWGGKSAGKLLGLGNGDWELNLLWTQARSAARREKHKQLARKDDISPTIGTELGTSEFRKGT